MYENNETTPEPQPVPREMLEARIQELIGEIERLSEKVASYSDGYATLRSKIDKAEREFKEILAGDMDASDIIESYGAVMVENLDWEFSREVEVVISVTWRGTVELPFGTEVSDLDIDDFGLNEPEHGEYSSYFRGIDDYSIEER
jgi:hypothetical protein